MQRSLVTASGGGHKAVLGRRPIALVVGVRKRLLFLSARVFFSQCSMISCGLSKTQEGAGADSRTRTPTPWPRRSSQLFNIAASSSQGSDMVTLPRCRRGRRIEEGKSMAKLQAAGRLLVILLALFLLVVAPAQAARFTSNHLTLNYLSGLRSMCVNFAMY